MQSAVCSSYLLMRPFILLSLSLLLTIPAISRADGAPDPAKDPQVARLLEAKKTLNWNHTVGNSKDRYGHAEALVAAPADKLAIVALDFQRYRDLHRKFATARVI